MIENYPTPQPGASLLLSFNPSKRSESRNTILFLSPNKLTSTRSCAALEAGYKILIGSHIDDQQWDEELVYRKRLGQVGEIEWNLSEKADKEDWENWLDGLGTPLRKEILLIVLNDTLPFGGSAPPATPPGSGLASSAPSPSTIERKRRTFASAVAFQQVASDWNFLVNVADAPTLSDFTWPITHRFTLSTQPSATPSTTHSTLYDSKSPLQMALTTNSSVCRLTSRIKREIVAALPETIGSAVLAISNLRSDLIHKADEESKAIQEREEEEGWDDDDDDEEASLNQPVRQLTSQQAEALDQVQLGGGWPRGKSELEIVEERALSPCRARAISRSRSRSTGGRSDIRSSSILTSQSSRMSTISSAPSSIHTISSPVASGWTASQAQVTRMRYIAQISEYWPIDRLAEVTMHSLLASVPAPPHKSHPSTPRLPLDSSPPTTPTISHGTLPTLTLPITTARHPFLLDFSLSPPLIQKGRIILLGTGTGNPLLLTRLAHLFLTSPPGSPYHVDLFLCDKLVPQEILAIIPTKEVRDGVMIARKYPGNAEHAQDELMRLAVEGARAGKTVLRMKQGDPYLFGRGGEEVLHFREAGFEALVIPGLSSSIAGPTIAGIPVTQRGVAESMVLCTGVGRGGREVKVDGYDRGKTLVVLMGVARLDALIQSLLHHATSAYPSHLPIALIERASSPDQRVISSTLENISAALKRLSAHRPPGMLVIGWGVMCLDGQGDMTILDDENLAGSHERDIARVKNWVGADGYRVREGLGEGWRRIVEGL